MKKSLLLILHFICYVSSLYGGECPSIVYYPKADFVGTLLFGEPVMVIEDTQDTMSLEDVITYCENELPFQTLDLFQLGLTTSSSDNTAKVWNLEGTLISDMVGHENSVNDVNFSPDDKFILTTGFDRRAKVWPILTIDEVIRKLERNGVDELNDVTKKKYEIEQ